MAMGMGIPYKDYGGGGESNGGKVGGADLGGSPAGTCVCARPPVSRRLPPPR